MASQQEEARRLQAEQQQMLDDERLARQLDQDEQLARDLQQQLLMEDEEEERRLMMLRAQQQQARGVNPAAAAYNDPRVHRPSAWGADGPPPATQAPASSIGDSIYNAGSAVAGAAGSLWSWATGGDDEWARASATTGIGRSRRRGGGGGGTDAPSMELQPMSRAPPDDDALDLTDGGVGYNMNYGAEGRGGDRGRGRYPDASDAFPSDLRDAGAAADASQGEQEDRVVRGDVATSWSHSSSSGAVRRRAPRQLASSTHDNDLL